LPYRKLLKPIKLPCETVSGVGPRNRVLDGRAHRYIGAKWQIRLNGCAQRLSGSSTRSGDAACSQITLGNLVITVIVVKACKAVERCGVGDDGGWGGVRWSEAVNCVDHVARQRPSAGSQIIDHSPRVLHGQSLQPASRDQLNHRPVLSSAVHLTLSASFETHGANRTTLQLSSRRVLQ